MNEQQTALLLQMLKTDLGIMTTAYDNRLGEYLRAAASMIGREGITLDYEAIEDCQLVVMYAAWTWRKRDYSDTAGMPRMIRYALNNRLFSQRVKE